MSPVITLTGVSTLCVARELLALFSLLEPERVVFRVDMPRARLGIREGGFCSVCVPACVVAGSSMARRRALRCRMYRMILSKMPKTKRMFTISDEISYLYLKLQHRLQQVLLLVGL